MKKPLSTAAQAVQKQRRRNRLINALIVLLLLALVAGGLVMNIRYNRQNYTVEFYQMESKKLTHSIRVAFLTDVHLREYGKNNEDLVQEVKNLAPDIILLGGDMVTAGKDGYDTALKLCERLAQLAPTYGVLGNHEDVKIFQQGDTSLVSRFEATGVHILRNEKAEITLYDNVISILGVEGSADNFELYGAKTFMDAQEGNDDSDFRICVTHVPYLLATKLADYSFELGLSGHTHGGLIRLPKIGGLYSAEEGFLPKYVGGQYTLKNKAEMIVSRGLGDSTRIPRINNIPELSIIDID